MESIPITMYPSYKYFDIFHQGPVLFVLRISIRDTGTDTLCIIAQKTRKIF